MTHFHAMRHDMGTYAARGSRPWPLRFPDPVPTSERFRHFQLGTTAVEFRGHVRVMELGFLAQADRNRTIIGKRTLQQHRSALDEEQ